MQRRDPRGRSGGASRTCPSARRSAATVGRSRRRRAVRACSPSRPAPGSTSATSARSRRIAAGGAVAARFGPLEHLSHAGPRRRPRAAAQQLLDLAGDGRLDVVAVRRRRCRASSSARRRRAGSRSAPFASLPNVDLDAIPTSASSISTGDGHADVLITEDDVFTWYPSLGEEGFGAGRARAAGARRGDAARAWCSPTARSRSTSPTCRGDGLSDLVRIRNGEVCYWPNLGYGRFGAKVTMDDAPWFDAPDQFDQRRIRLADIDGRGTTDIIYLAATASALLQSVRATAGARRAASDAFPPIDDLASIVDGRSARQRHRVPRVVVAAAGRRARGRCATST